MKNPFQYGGIVRNEAFCNRQKEVSDLLKAARNGDRLFLYSERRLGKTSLVTRALEKLPKRDFLTVYVDLWTTDDETSFATTTARAIARSLGSTTDRLLETARSLFASLVPSVALDDEGKPQVSFAVQRAGPRDLDLGGILKVPQTVAGKTGKNVVVVFDEFQQILEYGSDRVERSVRSAIQTHDKVAYFFLGSRKHLIRRMFLQKSRPLYRAGGHYPLGPIQEEHWRPFIQERFQIGGKTIAAEQIRRLCAIAGGHPFYTQHLCHAVWDLCGEHESVTPEMVREALRVLLARESYAYTALWDSLSANQRLLLKGLAQTGGVAKPFGSSFIERHGLRSPSIVQRALGSLLRRDVIDRDNGSYVIVDRFFTLWIQDMQQR